MIVVAHPTGNEFVRAVLAALHRRGLLAEFATTLAFDRGSVWLRALPVRVRKELLRRSYPVPRTLVWTRPWREAVRLAGPRSLKHGLGLVRDGRGWASVDSVYLDLDRHVAARLPQFEGITGVYAYEDGAMQCFRAAKRLGLPRYYDLPIGYWKTGNRLLSEEAALHPEWAPTLAHNLHDADRAARKDAELELASVVFVASSFTKRTLVDGGWQDKTIHVVPYGAPRGGAPVPEGRARSGRKLRALFVGGLGQRKGLGYLLTAMEQIEGIVDLTLIGRPAGEPCAAIARAIGAHRHIPSLPHDEILAEMRRHDVLVFPSLFEGFGLVLSEAMSEGLPVITTTNSAGPDLITEGKEGFIVPIRSSDAIAERLAWMAGHRDDVQAMGEAARRRVSAWTWEDYGDAVVSAIAIGAGGPNAAPSAAVGK